MIQEAKQNRKAEKYQINLFTEQFEKLSKPLTEFDDQLFRTIVKYITIYKERFATVTFLDGVEVKCAWD